MNESPKSPAEQALTFGRLEACCTACHGVVFAPMGGEPVPQLGCVGDLVERANALVTLIARSDALPRGENPCVVLEPELGNLQWILAQFVVDREPLPKTRSLFVEDEAGRVVE